MESSPLLKKEQPAEEKLSVVLEKAKQSVNEKEKEKISDHLDRLKNNGKNGDVQNAVKNAAYVQRQERLNELRQRYALANNVYKTCHISDFLETVSYMNGLFVPSIQSNYIKIDFIFSRDGDYLLVRMNERSKEKIISIKSSKIKCVFEDEDDKYIYLSCYGRPVYQFDRYIKNVFEAVSLNGEIRYSLEQLLGKS